MKRKISFLWLVAALFLMSCTESPLAAGRFLNFFKRSPKKPVETKQQKTEPAKQTTQTTPSKPITSEQLVGARYGLKKVPEGERGDVPFYQRPPSTPPKKVEETVPKTTVTPPPPTPTKMSIGKKIAIGAGIGGAGLALVGAGGVGIAAAAGAFKSPEDKTQQASGTGAGQTLPEGGSPIITPVSSGEYEKTSYVPGEEAAIEEHKYEQVSEPETEVAESVGAEYEQAPEQETQVLLSEPTYQTVLESEAVAVEKMPSKDALIEIDNGLQEWMTKEDATVEDMGTLLEDINNNLTEDVVEQDASIIEFKDLLNSALNVKNILAEKNIDEFEKLFPDQEFPVTESEQTDVMRGVLTMVKEKAATLVAHVEEVVKQEAVQPVVAAEISTEK